MDNLTKQYYEKKANKYFQTTFSTELPDLWKLGTESIPLNGFVLDLGSGSGRDLKYFSSKNYCTIGVDSSFNLSSLAHQATKQPIILADMQMIPFRSETFDLVWSIGSLLHIPKKNIANTLLEVKRVLRKGGRLITSVKEGKDEQVDIDGRFFAYYKFKEWRQLLKEAGFIIENLYFSDERRFISTDQKTIIVRWLVSKSKKK
jgi:ubiquinone/menaquinone biosynthesis C-methylase UbiE